MEILQNLEQSNIASINYHNETCTLLILFHNGNIHKYINVSEETWQALTLADHKLKYLKSHILKQHKLQKDDRLDTRNRW
jgi:hypothetical protein